MGRIRSIKPSFFKHEELFEAEKASSLPLRVAFAGLWTLCDREGRFEWKPRTLKTDVMPYDAVDFGAVLDALAQYGFIEKYEVDGKPYGHVPSWKEHQVINPRESKSVIPFRDASPRVDEVANSARGEVEGKGKEVGREKEGDAYVHARILSESVGNLNIHFQEQLSRQIVLEAKAREWTFEKTRVFMLARWTNYNANRGMLNYPVASAAKFFESGTWSDENNWPWKEQRREPGVIREREMVTTEQEDRSYALDYWRSVKGKPAYNGAPAWARQEIENAS